MTTLCYLCGLNPPVCSHIIPKALFRKLRGDGQNPNPFHITKEKTIQTSRQITGPILCQECEQRFNKNGERWMMANCYQPKRKSFPLREAAMRGPVEHGSQFNWVPAMAVPELCPLQLEYFAASLFWRVSVYDHLSQEPGSFQLGPYEEDFGSYLLGNAPFPRNSALIICLSTADPPPDTFGYPVTMRIKGCHAHRFVMLGLCFDLLVGKRAEDAHKVSFVHASQRPMFLTARIEDWINKGILNLAKT